MGRSGRTLTATRADLLFHPLSAPRPASVGRHASVNMGALVVFRRLVLPRKPRHRAEELRSSEASNTLLTSLRMAYDRRGATSARIAKPAKGAGSHLPWWLLVDDWRRVLGGADYRAGSRRLRALIEKARPASRRRSPRSGRSSKSGRGGRPPRERWVSRPTAAPDHVPQGAQASPTRVCRQSPSTANFSTSSRTRQLRGRLSTSWPTPG